jgi:hypothetical protein
MYIICQDTFFQSDFQAHLQNCEKRLLASSVLPVSPIVRPSFHLSVRLSAWNNSAPAGWIFMITEIWGFFGSPSRIYKFHYTVTCVTGTLHEYLCTFMVIFQLFLEQEMLHTIVVEKIKAHIVCSIIFFPENRAVYEIMWKKMVQSDRPHVAIPCRNYTICMPDN